jgi:4'-phosphopantetheinyl transferase
VAAGAPELAFVDNWTHGPERPALEPGEVHLWRIALDAGVPVGADPLAALAPAERRRADSFLRREDAHQFALTRAAVRDILGRYLDTPAADVTFSTGRGGKPRALGRDGAPGPRYNSTHSHRLALCAVASVDVGVDLEWMRPAPIAAGIAAGIVSPDGPIRADEPASVERDWAFFTAWTRTEAALKATGEGLSAIDRRPPAMIRALAELRTGAYAPGLRIVDLPVGLDYVGALAMIGGGSVAVTRCWTWEPVGRDPEPVLDLGGGNG